MPDFEFLLEGYRALDLTDEKGFLCGRILSDLGVDVIKIEKPGGDVSRRFGPFYQNTPDSEKSLNWFAYNAGKRGITLDIESVDGQDIFMKLVKSADFVIESFAPDYLLSIDLDYKKLSEVNPRIILTSITGFGQTGPYSQYKAPDLVVAAMGGQMYCTGDRERPPVRISFPQSYVNASSEAAAGTMIAHYFRQKTGEGQHVDTSAQQSFIQFTGNGIPFWVMEERKLERMGIYRAGLASALQRQLWKCKDGFITFMVTGGHIGERTVRPLVEWMESEGFADKFLLDIKWNELDMSKITQETLGSIEQRISEFFETHTKDELYRGGVERHIMIYPVSNAEDIMQNKQLLARDFWTDLEHDELNTDIKYPGTPIKSSLGGAGIKGRAPLIGEHNKEVYQELGIYEDELIALKEANVV